MRHYCVQHRKNALLIQIGVEIVWDNVDSMNGWILGCVSGIPPQIFLQGRMTSQRRETGIEIIKHTP